ncbi:mycothiol transferase [Marisediminicola sp. LYQ134]|uniref:mycothiol transferase n=1 Tax=Marisediminicola sp. LYQ134 TaxID=3391061 RepID=UPI0039831AD5
MTSANIILTDAFERVRDTVHAVTDGLTADRLTYRVDDEANTIAWLIWHLTRVQDDHVADVMGADQLWTSQGFADDFGLPFDASDIGYGQSEAEVAAVAGISAEQLIAYHDAVCDRTIDYVGTLADDDLARVVDTNWSPPVTLSMRLVSVISDDLQHAGQAAFVRGVVERR